MAITYRKATSIKELLTTIHELDNEYVREHGTSLVIPIVDNKTRKLIIRELKKLKIYHKVQIIETDNAKKFYEKVMNGYHLYQKMFHNFYDN